MKKILLEDLLGILRPNQVLLLKSCDEKMDKLIGQVKEISVLNLTAVLELETWPRLEVIDIGTTNRDDHALIIGLIAA